MNGLLIIGANPTGLILANQFIKHDIPFKLIDNRASKSNLSMPVCLSPSMLELFNQTGLLSNKFFLIGRKISTVSYSENSSCSSFNLKDESSFQFPFLFVTTYEKLEGYLIDLLISQGGSINWKTKLITIIDSKAFLEKVVEDQEIGQREVYSPNKIIVCEPDSNLEIKDTLKCNVKILKENVFVSFIPNAISTPSSPNSSSIQIFYTQEKNLGFLLPFSETENANSSFLLFSKKKEILDLENQQTFSSFKTFSLSFNKKISRNFKITQTIFPLKSKNIFFVGSRYSYFNFMQKHGINVNIQEAFNLAWKLILIMKNIATHNLLDSYEVEISNVVKILGIHKINKSLKLFSVSQKFFSSPIFNYLKKIPFLKICHNISFQSKSLDNICFSYKNSPIIKFSPQEKQFTGPRPGELAPNIKLEDGSYIFDKTQNSKHVILFFKDQSSLIEALNEEYGEWVNILVIKEKKVSSLYHATPDSLYIIRPDFYIGYRSHSFKIRELITYLLRIFKLPSNISQENNKANL